MTESTLTSKGQTTVPQHIREAIGAEAGTRLVWHLLPNGGVVVRAKSQSLMDLAGRLKPSRKKRVAIDAMNAWR